MSAEYEAVDRFIADHFLDDDSALAAALEDSAKAGLPAIQVAPHQGKLPMLLAAGDRRAANSRSGYARRL